ncbi:putative urea ABC transporter substrate-binding protein [Magnetofaba australis]|uniref:Putative nitrate/sulfonate/bicarbonate ABC transporter periplasmic protein n=1 Tax=Magnetofaba australis IT-1 TaxID=1434232 RepID=A0A1Y2K0N4_9PROT|nr:putative urea ABC transporter substrate-binding protein [Magnetofaba australis]OSM01593.1 putative nitrate/sulfonate/bicarbonate ABC transporter periplasmic protein [Magnetofaba australis IT-1]
MSLIRHFSRALIGLTLLSASAAHAAAPRCHIAWSHYTGWEPVGYIQDSGIAARWGKKMGVDLQFTLINDYIESVNQYTAGSFDGVTVTNMDGLTIPAVGGVDTTVLVVGDFSNGNDAILVKSADNKASVHSLKSKPVKLVELSVSHYLLARALDKNGMAERDLSVVNTSDADLGGLIAAAADGDAFVTWNPIVMTALQQPGVVNVFDSAQIPGEIIDTIMVRTDADDACKRAVTGAWYEAMGQMSQGGAKTQQALSSMAAQAGGSEAEFQAQLRTTRMFYEPKQAAEFSRSQQLKDTMRFVAKFSFDHGLYGNGASDETFIGIAYPDGSVWGNADFVKLRFDATYMQMAADGKL